MPECTHMHFYLKLYVPTTNIIHSAYSTSLPYNSATHILYGVRSTHIHMCLNINGLTGWLTWLPECITFYTESFTT